VYFEPGWGSYEYLRLRAGYREKNLLGTGRVGRVEGGISFRSEDISVGLTDPWFLNTDITADLPFYYRRREEPSFNREERGGSLSLSRKFSRWLTATVTYDYRITSITNVQVNAQAEDLMSAYNLGSVKAQATHDTRNDIFFPTGGQRSSLSGEVAETYLGSDVTFVRGTGGTRWFFDLAPFAILGVRYDTGLVVPTGNTVSLPLAERFFNGGESTVRSFLESQRLLGRAAPATRREPGGDPVLRLRKRVPEPVPLRADRSTLPGQVGTDLRHPERVLPRIPAGRRGRRSVSSSRGPGTPRPCLEPESPGRRTKLRCALQRGNGFLSATRSWLTAAPLNARVIFVSVRSKPCRRLDLHRPAARVGERPRISTRTKR
jgi:hypothetical protein